MEGRRDEIPFYQWGLKTRYSRYISYERSLRIKRREKKKKFLNIEAFVTAFVNLSLTKSMKNAPVCHEFD